MATIENLYTGDGSTVLFSFTFEYIEEVDVEVSIDSVTIATTEYSLANSTTIEFNTAPASGAAVRIYRNTTVNTPKATFFPGSAIRAQDLNDNFEQILFVTQEADAISERAELAADQAQIATTAALAASDTATAAATSAQSAASTAQAQVTAAQSAAASAAADANTAITTADAAVATANTAEATANTANSNAAAAAANAAGAATSASTAASEASAAQASATSAQTSATNALSQAAAAQSSASSAQTSATNAAASALDAANDAATALSTANTANATANTASTDASTALTAANNAVSTANAASATANTASTDAASAVSTADSASTAAGNAVTTANTAANDAANAVATANGAATDATTALNTADAAETTADTAAVNATNAVATANAASLTATGAETTANSAATDAANAVVTAGNADTAAANAVTTANSAATDAATAISTANSAAADATTALSTANSAATDASQAQSKADAAISAVSEAYLFTVVADVASIPSSPADGDAVRVADSSGIENLSGIQNVPSGFVGDSGLNVEIIYSGTNWSFLEYTANDPDDRYGYPPFVDVTRQNTVDMATLSGVALNATNLGTFTGSTITDNQTIKGALQDLESGKADLIGGKVPTSQIPALGITEFLGSVGSEAALLGLSGQRGDWAIRTDNGKNYVLTSDGGSSLSDWTQLVVPNVPVDSVNGQTGVVVLGPADVGALASTGGTISGNLSVTGTVNGRDYDADGTKLDGIESGATGDQTAAEIRALVAAATDSQVFTDADHTKLDGIAAGAQVNVPTNLGVSRSSTVVTISSSTGDNTSISEATPTNAGVMTSAMHDKLDGIEAGATGDQSAAEIRTLVGAATDSNVFTDGYKSKLDGIEAGATGDQTASEILTLIKTVDGSGSGLDADTLDGISSGSFLRSDATDTASSKITFSAGTGAVTLAANSDIRFQTGSWTGEATTNEGKIQYHSNNLYFQSQNEWYFRNGAGSNLFTFDGSGNLTATGNVTAYSDIRLKKDIELIPNALDKVLSLRGVTFTDIATDERRTGVIAQEVQVVLPEAVKEGEEYLSVAYGNLVGVLIESIKELKAEIDQLKEGR